jgi:F-type H+-transporting ATPase subunit epsilon
MATLKVNLLSPSQPLFEGEVVGVKVPGIRGEMGILPGHTAIVAQLGIGELELAFLDRKPARYFVSGGYLQVEQDEVNLLVDVVEPVSGIDLERAAEAAERAIARLNDRHNLDINIPRALASLSRARAREALARQKGQEG